jgi:tRNA 2-thiouridine synthesizing protein E
VSNTLQRVDFGAILIDDEGYPVDRADWTEAAARTLAGRENLTLTDLHWRVPRFMCAFHVDHQITADARFVIRFLADEAGFGAAARSKLFELLPYGYVK